MCQVQLGPLLLPSTPGSSFQSLPEGGSWLADAQNATISGTKINKNLVRATWFGIYFYTTMPAQVARAQDSRPHYPITTEPRKKLNPTKGTYGGYISCTEVMPKNTRYTVLPGALNTKKHHSGVGKPPPEGSISAPRRGLVPARISAVGAGVDGDSEPPPAATAAAPSSENGR